MSDSQVPCGVEALPGEVTEPAWRAKPSRYLVPTRKTKRFLPMHKRSMVKGAGSDVVEVKAVMLHTFRSQSCR